MATHAEAPDIEETLVKLKTAAEKDKDDFILVKSRSRKKRDLHKEEKFYDNSNESASDIAGRKQLESKEEILKKIQTCIKLLENNSYYNTLVELVEKTFEKETGLKSYVGESILCLGLGIFSSYPQVDISPARYQLALLVLLKKRFGTPVEVYDPLFMPVEKSILREEFGFIVSEEDKEGKYIIDRPTLLFLPHCPHYLINSFLYTNWNSDALRNCFILSNSLSTIVLCNPRPSQLEKLPFIVQSHHMCTEIPVPSEFKYNKKAFNDTSLHYFTDENLSTLSLV